MSNGPLADLEDALQNMGLVGDSLHTASALLGLARIRGWSKDDLREPVAWLAQIACEVLLVPRFSTVPHRTATPEPAPACPALDGLQERLVANGVTTETRKVASAILSLALAKGWSDEPTQMLDWLERLAVDVANQRSRRGR